MTDWVDVRDNLPFVNTHVLVSVMSIFPLGRVERETVITSYEKEGFTNESCGHVIKSVTHWMLLPEIIMNKKMKAREIIHKALNDIKKLGLKPELDFSCNLDHVSEVSEKDFVFYSLSSADDPCPKKGKEAI